MKASITSRITCSVLAATLMALPCNEALAAPAAAPAPAPTAAPAAAPVPATAPAAAPAPASDPAAPAVDPNAPPTDAAPTDSRPADEVPTEVGTPVEAPAEAAPAPAPEPLGPERPPEPTVANGKYKAKGTGLMIAGGALLGLSAAGLVTSILLTRCDTLENNFACRNQQNSTFAVPATAAATLLGAVLLFVGVGYRLRYKRWEKWTPENAPKTAVYPTLLRGGAGVGYSLKF